MVTLAIDTSQRVGSVALARAGNVIASRTFGAESSHLVELSRSTASLLGEAGLTIGDVTRLALVIGPGSFTGLRVGLAYVKGLVAARPIEVVTIDTLELLAAPCRHGHELTCVMVDARRQEVYAAAYDDTGTVMLESAAIAPRDFLGAVTLARPHFVGSGADVYREEVLRLFPEATFGSKSDQQPSTDWLASFATTMQPLPADSVRHLEPKYLRPSGAQRKKLRPVDI